MRGASMTEPHRFIDATLLRVEQGLEVEVRARGSWATGERARKQRHGGKVTLDERVRLHGARTP